MRHTGIREQIRASMLEHARRHPLAKPLGAKQIQAQYPDWPRSTIYWHMERIRAEADAAASCKHSNSDADSKAAKSSANTANEFARRFAHL